MAKVTYYPGTNLARLDDERVKAVLKITELDWKREVGQLLVGLHYFKRTPWDQSGQNYIAEFENEKLSTIASPGFRRNVYLPGAR